MLALILTVGLALRILYLAELVHSPFFGHPVFDADFHDYWAWGLASGDWSLPMGRSDPQIATRPYVRPPGYPYFLATIYSVGGRSHLAAGIVQGLLGLGSVLLAFVLGKRWVGAVSGGLGAALMAVHWTLIYFEGELLDPSLLVFLGLLLLWLLSLTAERVRSAPIAAAGVVLGLFALTRPNVLLFLPAAIAWLAWVASRRGEGRRLRLAVPVLLLAATATIAPATLRNHFVGKEWVPISSNGGVNLFIGNNDKADGITAALPDVEELTGAAGWTCYDYPQVVSALERRLGRPLGFAGADAHWASEAVRWIVDHPGRFLVLTAKRAALFWGPSEAGDRDVDLARGESRVLSTLPARFPLVLTLAVVGAAILLLELRRHPGTGPEAGSRGASGEVTTLVLLFVAIYSASFLPFFFEARYRVPILPYLLLLASYGLVRVARLALSRQAVKAIGWSAACLALYPVLATNFVGYRPRADEWHFLLGEALQRQGRTEPAIRHFEEALRLNPRHSIAHNSLGVVLNRLGRRDEAITHLWVALQINPLYPNAHFNLGAILLADGRVEEAVEHYRKGLEINPRDPYAQVNFGTALLESGRHAEAEESFRAALRLAPDEARAHLGLGQALLALGRPQEAAAAFREALRLRPSSAAARQGLGLASAALGLENEAAHSGPGNGSR